MHEQSLADTQQPARLLLVAHGTRSADGLRTTRQLRDAVAAARPTVTVELCYLDVVDPRLPDVLTGDDGPTVVLPALLSTGYHVQQDIPAAVGDRPSTLLARHLGPDPLLVDAMFDRLPAGPGVPDVLVAAGSTRPEAHAELAAVARLVADRTGVEVRVLTMTDDLDAALSAPGEPRRVLTYLLAEGQFVDTLRAAAGPTTGVGDPIGVHPALVRLVWARYDEAIAQQGAEPVG